MRTSTVEDGEPNGVADKAEGIMGSLVPKTVLFCEAQVIRSAEQLS